MYIKTIAVFFLLVSLSACKTTKVPVNPRENLETVIPHAISLLTNKDYKTFFETYIDPETLELILRMKPMDEMVKGFSEKNASRLIDALNKAKGKTPKYDEDGSKATFSKDDIEGMPKSLVFKKVDKYWYIDN